jgi:hypothetical protein
MAEIAQGIVILAFSFAMPVLVGPTVFVLLIVLLDRLGFTLLGKVIVLVALGAVIRLFILAWANGW